MKLSLGFCKGLSSRNSRVANLHQCGNCEIVVYFTAQDPFGSKVFLKFSLNTMVYKILQFYVFCGVWLEQILQF
jgi:hypothetical protein